MYFQPGDIVLKKSSKAQNIKSKVFKIVAKLNGWQYSDSYHVVTPFGKLKILKEYQLITLKDAIANAERAILTAESEKYNREKYLAKLKTETKNVNSFFPIV